MEVDMLRVCFSVLLLVIGGLCASKDAVREKREVTYDTSKVLKVTSILEKPYLMVKNASWLGNERYEGFIADLLVEMSVDKSFPFRYELNIVKDGEHGSRSADGNWTGMVGEVQRGEADFAAAPLKNTPANQVTLKFTKPFIDIHIAMLMKRTDKELPVKTLQDLLNQTSLKYGWVGNSLTEEAFLTSKDPAIRQAWAQMYAKSNGLASLDDGINKVKESGFILITESTTGEYIANQKPCTLMTTGQIMDLAGYGIAVEQANTELYKKLDKTIDNVRKSGKLDKLYAKWWLDQGCEPYGPRAGQSTDGSTRHALTLSVFVFHTLMMLMFTLIA